MGVRKILYLKMWTGEEVRSKYDRKITDSLILAKLFLLIFTEETLTSKTVFILKNS